MKKNEMTAIGPSLPCVLLSWTHDVLLFFGFYALFADFAGVTGTDYWIYAMLGFLLFIPACASWLLLKKIRLLFLYDFVGFLLSLGLGMLEGYWFSNLFTYSRMLTTVFTFFVSMLMFIIHTSARLTHGRMKKDFLAVHGDVASFELEVWEVSNILSAPSPTALIWFSALYLVGAIVKLTNFWHLAFYLTLAEVFVCFMYKYLYSFTEFLQKSHKSANIPVSTIKRVHKIIFIIALFLLSVVVLPSVLYNREPLSTLESKEVTFDMEDSLPDASQMQTSPNPSSMDQMLEQMGVEESELPEWVGILVQIFLWLMVLLALCVFIAGIIRSIKHALVDFNVDDEDEIIFLDSEEGDVRSSVSRQVRNDGLLSANAQIRRRYKKLIKKATKGTPSCWATPTELEAAAQIQHTVSTNALHELYEKARYSEKGCTKADLKNPM